MKYDREYTDEERVAIAELVHMAECCTLEDGTPRSPMHQALGAIFLERAAGIVRGEIEPLVFEQKDIIAFAQFWKAEERAAFNPKEEKK